MQLRQQKVYLIIIHRKNARRIYCYVDDYNTRSQQLCKRLGMRQEGLFLSIFLLLEMMTERQDMRIPCSLQY